MINKKEYIYEMPLFLKLKPISESIVVKFLTPYEFWHYINSFHAFIVMPALFAWMIGSLYSAWKFDSNRAAIEQNRLQIIVDYIQREK